MLAKFLRILVFICCLQAAVAWAEDIRVGIVTDQSTVALNAEQPFTVTDLVSNTSKTVPKGKYFLHLGGNDIVFNNKLAFSSQIEITPLENKALPVVNNRHYFGSYKIFNKDYRLTVVNTMDLDKYLAQILPSKSMVVWPDEAIKAQAVAARTYALYKKEQASGELFDLLANDEELPYLGVTQFTEKPAITKLIQATSGEYLVTDDGRPILALSTSSTGGKTDSSAQVLGEAYAYLRPVEDYDEDSPEHNWQVRVTPVNLQKLLEQRGYHVGKLNSVRLSPLKEYGLDRTANGRVRYVIFAGDAGSARVSGHELVQLFNLNSNLFDVETGTPVPESINIPITNSYGMEIGSKDVPIKVKEEDKQVWSNLRRSIHMLSGGKDEKIVFKGLGKGLGLGLSAWGARGMVTKNEKITHAEILAHYYPGTSLIK